MNPSAAASLDERIAPDEHQAPAPEADLVRLALVGDADAAREIVRSHHQRIFNFVHQLTRHRQDAEDIAQETFVKAFRGLHRFDTNRPLANWLLTIARRTALNHFRSARKWELLPDDTPAQQSSPDRDAEQHDQVDDIWDRARRLLSRREFEVLWLRFGEDLSVEETARTAGLTRTHVKVLVFRARQRLMERKAPP
jgi:RNA polymerase sigma-70 factor (ECF subfamily)